MTPTERLRLHGEMEKRIERHDYNDLFAFGGCFEFALRLHERFGYRIRGIRGGHNESLSHVWCKTPDCKCVDIHGVYPETEIVSLAYGGPDALKWGIEPEDVSADAIREKISEREYPSELKTKILSLADWILDNDERFATARL